MRNCPQSLRPSQSVGSTPYQAQSHQNVYQGAGKGSRHVQRSQGGHPPSVPVGHNFALPAPVLATSGTTGPSVIRTIVPLFTSWESILFDTGASHSFISSAFTSSLGLKVDCLDVELHVNTLVRGIVCLNQVCRGCLLFIDERQLCIDLIVMLNLEFDIIIGRDFLSAYRASIDYFKR